MFILYFSISFVCLVVTLFILCVIPLWDSVTAHSPSSKELNPSSQDDARFSGRCTSAYNFHSILRHLSLGLSNSSLTLRQRAQSFLSGRCLFFRALHLGIHFLLHPASSLFGTQQQLTHPPIKSTNFPLLKNHVSQGLLFVNVLTLSCLGSLWFATHPYYSLNPYVSLYYPWSISIAKDRRYP